MPRVWRRTIPIIGIWLRSCLRILSGSRERAERVVARVTAESFPRPVQSNAKLKADAMQDLSPRHVKTEESLRLGVVSGWYSTKVSGTFVSGPHDSEADCLRKIAEINPPKKSSRGSTVT